MRSYFRWLVLGLAALLVACGGTVPAVTPTAGLTPPVASATPAGQAAPTVILTGQAAVDYQEAQARYRRGDYDGAVAALSRVIAAQPDFVPAYLLRGALRNTRQGVYDQAVADFTQALTLNPTLRSAYQGRARTYSDQLEYDKAIADYTRALHFPADQTIPDYALYLLVASDDVDLYIDRGRAYQGKGDLDHALADLSEAVARDPAMWRARLVRAGIYEAQGDQPAAIADYQEVLQITDVDEIQARARKRLKALGVANP